MAEEDVRRMISGFIASQALYVAAKLRVFDVIRDKPKTAIEIAKATGSHEPSLRRLLRFLTAVAVLVEDDQGCFSSTEMGNLLRSDHPDSARPWAVLFGEPFIWQSWGNLYETVKTGVPGFDRAHGEGFFDYLARHSQDAATFNAAMTSSSRDELAAILSAYDFHLFTKVVDVGGGQGALLRGILEQCPGVRGVLCDLPSVVAGTSELRHPGVASRCEFVGGDFFKAVPAGGDAYILKKIVHDWNDADVLRILQNCRRAIAPGGKLLVIEAVVQPSNQPDSVKWKDLNMLTLVTGRERTLAEFGELYGAAGLRLTRVVPAMSLSIIEGVAL